MFIVYLVATRRLGLAMNHASPPRLLHEIVCSLKITFDGSQGVSLDIGVVKGIAV